MKKIALLASTQYSSVIAVTLHIGMTAVATNLFVPILTSQAEMNG